MKSAVDRDRLARVDEIRDVHVECLRQREQRVQPRVGRSGSSVVALLIVAIGLDVLHLIATDASPFREVFLGKPEMVAMSSHLVGELPADVGPVFGKLAI